MSPAEQKFIRWPKDYLFRDIIPDDNSVSMISKRVCSSKQFFGGEKHDKKIKIVRFCFNLGQPKEKSQWPFAVYVRLERSELISYAAEWSE